MSLWKARLAAERNCGTEAFVRELVANHLDHDAWFRRQVLQGLSQLDRGESLSQEEVEATINRMFHV